MNSVINEIRPKLLTLKEAARYSGISEYYLRKTVKQHKVASVRAGAKYLVDADALDELIKAGAQL